MEHEVFVPFPVGTVRQALADGARVARCLPGFQTDTDEVADASDALGGRLRLRLGNSSITYRGTIRITGRDDGDLAVEAEGTEARGSGTVKVALTVRLSPTDGGTALACSGTVHSVGRLAESDDAAAAAAGRRLLDRFATDLAADLETSPLRAGGVAAPAAPGEASGEDPGRTPGGEETGPTASDDNERVIPAIPAPENGRAADSAPAAPSDAADSDTDAAEEKAETDAAEAADADAEQDRSATADEESAGAPSESVFDTEVPPSSLDPLTDADADDDFAAEPPAEAAHARRTMIGRSAEEVDHAPPRGRYAPVPPPEVAAAPAVLRWAAPAAAVVLASAVVVSRVLRRRR